jgi:hypothetical protein
MSDAERLALLDHELTHVEVVYEVRPRKLRTRHHDRTYGWFDEVAQKHGEASQEVQQARRFAADEAGQLYFTGKAFERRAETRNENTEADRRPRSRFRGARRLTRAGPTPRNHD